MPLVKMKDLLLRAERDQIGCGAFNVGNMEMVKGAVMAAEEMNTPIIMQIAEGRLQHSPLGLMGAMMVQAAKDAKVDIAVHLDHGRSIETIKTALDLGFTSVMYDGSTLPLNNNIERTVNVVKLALCYGASAEGELGVVGGREGDGANQKSQHTNPDEAELFCNKTGVDALAVAIGNAHGNYCEAPSLQFNVLEQIKESTAVPLVLHGGSGISDADFKKAIRFGVRKINIATASFNALVKNVEMSLKMDVSPDFFKLNKAMVEGVYENIKRHIEIFNNPMRG